MCDTFYSYHPNTNSYSNMPRPQYIPPQTDIFMETPLKQVTLGLAAVGVVSVFWGLGRVLGLRFYGDDAQSNSSTH